MATSKVPVSPSAKQPLQFPQTFKQALQTGWTVVSEVTGIYDRDRRRYGTLTMRLKGQPYHLSIFYAATKAGFTFHEPVLRMIQ